MEGFFKSSVLYGVSNMSVFSDVIRQKIAGHLDRYESKRSAILPVLHIIQDEDGWIKDEHVEGLEKEYGLSAVDVREVLTFYSMYRTEKPAKFHVYFCDNMVCTMMGAKGAMEKVRQRIAAYEAKGIESPIGLQGVPCLGVCDGAPAMLVNKERHLRVSAENVDKILDQYAPL